MRRTETSGWKLSWNASWNEEASTASASRPSSRAASEKGYPTLPHARATTPAARIIAATISVVVVFPFVPVTPT